MNIEPGTRVKTSKGEGTVVYSRNSAESNYKFAHVYSVLLDSKKAESEQPPFPSYSGTIIPAGDVETL